MVKVIFKKKKNVKEERTQEETDNIFPGWKGMNQLSHVLMQEEEEEEEEEEVDDPDDSSIIPDSWALIMSNDIKIQDEFRKKIDEARKKKKLMPHCRKDGSNPYHAGSNAENPGGFTSRDNAKSWSIRMQKTGDCKAGVARMDKGRELFTKTDCGREGEWLCSEPSKKKREKNEDMSSMVEGEREQIEAYFKGIITKELKDAIRASQSSTGCSWKTLIQAITAWNDAEKGTPKRNIKKQSA